MRGDDDDDEDFVPDGSSSDDGAGAGAVAGSASSDSDAAASCDGSDSDSGGGGGAKTARQRGGMKKPRTAPRLQRIVVDAARDPDLEGSTFPGLAYILVRGQRQTVNVATSGKNLGHPGKALLSHGIGIYPIPKQPGMCQVTTGLQLNHGGTFIFAPDSKRNALRFSTGNFDEAGKGKRASCIIFMEFYRMVRGWLRAVRAKKAVAPASLGADASIPCGEDAYDEEDADTLAFDYTPLHVTSATQTLINKAAKLFERYRQAVQYASGAIQVEKSAVSQRGHLYVKLPTAPRISKTAAAKLAKGGGRSSSRRRAPPAAGGGGVKMAAAAAAAANAVAVAKKRLELRVVAAERNWPALHTLVQHCFTEQWMLTASTVELSSGVSQLLHAVWRYAILFNDEDAVDVLRAVAEAPELPQHVRQVAEQAVLAYTTTHDQLEETLAKLSLATPAAFFPQSVVDAACMQAKAVIAYQQQQQRALPLPLPLPLPLLPHKRSIDEVFI